jgi:transposase
LQSPSTPWLQELVLSVQNRGDLDMLLRILDAVPIEQAKLTELVNADAYGREGVKLVIILPGVGATIAQAMMAAIGNIDRFERPLILASYFALIPSVHQSAIGPVVARSPRQCQGALATRRGGPARRQAPGPARTSVPSYRAQEKG